MATRPIRTAGIVAILASALAPFSPAQDPVPPGPPGRSLEDLWRELDELRAELERARAPVARPQSASAFNPSITVFGNVLLRSDDRPAYAEDDPSAERVDDTFSLREIEIDLRAAVDPWADGVLIAAFEAEVPGEYEATIEEGYVLLKRLPWLETAPAGLKTKVGRFRPAFGRSNPIHLHDLPQPSYGRALRTFLGPEGFSADGISGQFFLPGGGENDVFDATVQFVNAGDIAVSPAGGGDGPAHMASLARVKWFRDLEQGRDVEIGVSGYTSHAENALWALDATWRWKPYVSGQWRSFVAGLEVFQADLDDGVNDETPAGYDLWAQYQLGRNLYAGLRWSEADDLVDSGLESRTAGAFLTAYTTEFLRLRLGYEHTWSDVDELDGLDSVFLELNFIYGAHPAEPYWVNR